MKTHQSNNYEVKEFLPIKDTSATVKIDVMNDSFRQPDAHD
jgi:hypothetical protein